jgi:hypothetical protein
MPKQDAAAILEEIFNEADALIRQRLKEKGIDLPAPRSRRDARQSDSGAQQWGP